MKKVAVIMSTYNGEEFLKEQLDSILLQEGVWTEIYIRDDGSKDGTKRILSQYSQKENIHLFCENNIGVGNSFMEMLYRVPAQYDYYAFSDQDDIWYPEKLAVAVEALSSHDVCLYASNQECTDREGNIIKIRHKKNPYTEPMGILSNNLLSGCTMVFNRKLFLLLTDRRRRPSCDLLRNRIHDVWVGMVASITGGIYYDAKAFIKYRQHEKNVVGAAEKNNLQKMREQIRKLCYKEERNGRSKLAAEIINKYPEFINTTPFLKYCAEPKKLKNKFYLILKNKRFRSYTKETWPGYVFKVMLNLF